MRSLKNLYALAGTGAATLSLLLVGTARAATINNNSALNTGGSGSVNTTQSFTSLFTGLANSALNIILLIAGVVAVFYLIWSGFQYITAAGSAEKAKAARAGIINAVIGIIIIVSAFFIVQIAVSGGNTINSSANFN